MRYLLLLYGDPAGEAALSPAERRAIVDAHVALGEELAGRGVLVAAAALTDGPYAETNEQLGSLYLVECADPPRRSSWPAGYRPAPFCGSRSGRCSSPGACLLDLGGCPRRARRRPARRRRSRYWACIGDPSGVPAETWSVSAVAHPMPTGADAERFRGVVDNAAGRRLGVAGAAEDPRDRP